MDFELKQRVSIVLQGLAGAGASCYRYEVSEDGLTLIVKYFDDDERRPVAKAIEENYKNLLKILKIVNI